MTISSQTFGQQTISVVLNEGQIPVKAVTGPNGEVSLQAAGNAVSLPKDTSANVLLLGDSITYNCGATFNTDGTASGRSWIHWANQLAGNCIKVVRNAGVSGNTSQQIYARIETDVLPYVGSINGVILMTGTNDPGTLTYAQSCSYFLKIINKLRSYGLAVYVIIPPPKTWTLPSQAQQLKDHLQRNRYQRDVATKTAGVYLLGDAFDVLVSPTSTSCNWNATSDSADASSPYIHPSNSGAAKIGLAIYSELAKLFPALHALPTSAGQSNANDANELLSDPLMLATPAAPGGSYTGTVPTGWSDNGISGGAVAASVVSSFRGIGNDIQLDITASGSGSAYLKLTWSTALQNAFLSNGPYKMVFGCGVQIDSGSNITGAGLQITFGGGAGSNPIGGLTVMQAGSPSAALPSGILTKPQTLVSGEVSIDSSMTNGGVFSSYSLFNIFVTWNAAGSARVRFTAPFVRIIQ